jgi:hypothetical protein
MVVLPCEKVDTGIVPVPGRRYCPVESPGSALGLPTDGRLAVGETT